jgi:DNA polymerase elongation subunit (family B)
MGNPVFCLLALLHVYTHFVPAYPACLPCDAVVAGRLLCDTYLAARDLVHEVEYTLSTLARNLLKQERAELNPADIPGGLEWWSRGVMVGLAGCRGGLLG